MGDKTIAKLSSVRESLHRYEVISFPRFFYRRGNEFTKDNCSPDPLCFRFQVVAVLAVPQTARYKGPMV
jgi:hypothetical protein